MRLAESTPVPTVREATCLGVQLLGTGSLREELSSWLRGCAPLVAGHVDGLVRQCVL